MHKIILASRSPRRLEILKNHGIDPIVMPTETDECLPSDIGMEDAVKMLALKKALACYNECLAINRNSATGGDSLYEGNSSSSRNSATGGDSLQEEHSADCRNNTTVEDDFAGAKIIGSDTIVYTDRILGKPADRDDARAMINAIRGTYHYVCTGVAVIDYDSGTEQVEDDVTRVYVRDMTDTQVEAYLDTDEPYDKAGAYAIQGIFGQYIDRYEGDYENVVGLPYHILEEML